MGLATLRTIMQAIPHANSKYLCRQTPQHVDHTTLKKETVGRLSTFSRGFYYQFKRLPSHSPEAGLLPLDEQGYQLSFPYI